MHHLEEKHASAKTRNDEFWNTYRLPIVAGIKFSWDLDRNSNVAANVYDVLKSIKNSPVLKENIKEGFQQNIQEVLDEIRRAYPKITPPKKTVWIQYRSNGI
jgi:hypothetical protein